MDHTSQNYCGCGSSRMPRSNVGTYTPARTVRPTPGYGCQNRMTPPPRSGNTGWCGEPIGMAYVPWQKFRDLYPYEKGLCAGTIFQELDKPFQAGRCAK